MEYSEDEKEHEVDDDVDYDCSEFFNCTSLPNPVSGCSSHNLSSDALDSNYEEFSNLNLHSR